MSYRKSARRPASAFADVRPRLGCGYRCGYADVRPRLLP